MNDMVESVQNNSKYVQGLSKILNRNANWDHENNGDIKEYESYSSSLWWNYLHMTCSLLQENLEPFPDTTACLSILFFLFCL